MIGFQNSKIFPIDRLKEREKTVSTLLVPASLIELLKLKKKEHGNNLSVYFRNLLWMYRTITHSGLLPYPRKIKTEYQDACLDLKRVSFRVSNTDWIEIGGLALAFGKSRCWVFTFLLELDLLGLWDILSDFGLNDAVPTKRNLLLRVSWSLQRTFHTFARSYHVKV